MSVLSGIILDKIKRLRIAFTANGKRQTWDSRLSSLEKTSTWMRIVQNNYGRWCQRKTTQFRLENGNSEPQMWDKHGHVVISAVGHKRNGPFAASGHMVQNPPCWRASCPLGHPEQSDFIKINLHFLCFGCPSAELALQHGGFCTMWPLAAKGPFRSIAYSPYTCNANGKNDHVTTIFPPFFAFAGCHFHVKTGYFAFPVNVRTTKVFLPFFLYI